MHGVMPCYKYTTRTMMKQACGGRLIAVRSIANKCDDLNSAAYRASKFAVKGFTQSEAIELAPYGIDVNCYAPWAISTPLFDRVDEKYTIEEGRERRAYSEKRAEATPLGRVAQAEDVSRLASFLTGPDSKLFTGQSIIVDGGTLFD